ncbi:MAG: hypothetical protein AB1632_01640 [Nitrospirota bacterium]
MNNVTSQSKAVSIPYRLILVFLILSFSIGTAGCLFYVYQKDQIKEAIRNELSAIADLKVKQITDWRTERIEDADVIIKNSLISHRINEFLQGSHVPEVRKELVDWMKSLQKHQRRV